MKKNTAYLFENTSIPRAYFALTVPTVLSKLVMMIYTLADTWFIAATENAALVVAVSICAPLTTTFAAIGDIWGVGGSSLVSRLFGKGDAEKANRVSALCIWGALLCGIVLAAVMLVFAGPILRLLGADAETYDFALQYYRIMALGAPAIVLSVVPMHMLRTEGLASQAMVGTMIGSGVHVAVLLAAMILGKNGPAVVAIAMVGGYGATLLSYLWNMIRKCSYCSASAKNLPGSAVHLQPVMSIGIPSALTTLLQGFAMTVTNRCLLTYGADPVAAYSIAIKLVSLVYTFQSGFAFGAQPLIGYHYSKEGSGRLKDILKFNYGFTIAVSAVTLAVFWIFAPQLMAMFLSDEKIVLLGADVIRRYALGFIFSGCILVSTTVFRAAGKAREAFILAIGRQGVFYVGILLIANTLFGYTGAITAQTLADFLTVVLAVILLKRVSKG